MNQFAVLHLISWLVNRKMLIVAFFANAFFPFHPQITVFLFFLSDVILGGPHGLSVSQENQNVLVIFQDGSVGVFFVVVVSGF